MMAMRREEDSNVKKPRTTNVRGTVRALELRESTESFEKELDDVFSTLTADRKPMTTKSLENIRDNDAFLVGGSSGR